MQSLTVSMPTLRALSKMLASDMARPALSQVGYRKGLLGASDGFVMLTVDAVGSLPEGTLFDAKKVLARSRGVKKPREVEIAVRDDSTQTAKIVSDVQQECLTIDLEAMSETSPDWQSALDSFTVPSVESVTVTISAELLKRVAEAKLALKTESPEVHFTVPINLNTGIKFEFADDEGRTYRGVLMPMIDRTRNLS